MLHFGQHAQAPACLRPSFHEPACFNNRSSERFKAQHFSKLAASDAHTGKTHDAPLEPTQLPVPDQWQPVQVSAQQQALDHARQHLLHQRQARPEYALLPRMSAGLANNQQAGLSQQILEDMLSGPGAPNDEDEESLKELQKLLPDLRGQWHRLQPQVVHALQADTGAVASKLMQLKVWLPSANVSIMVARWPTLVLDKEFSRIPDAIAVLQHWFDADSIDHMVEQQPLFLVEDIESAISSLNRWMSTTNGAHKLQRNPQLLTSLVPSQHPACWK